MYQKALTTTFNTSFSIKKQQHTEKLVLTDCFIKFKDVCMIYKYKLESKYESNKFMLKIPPNTTQTFKLKY